MSLAELGAFLCSLLRQDGINVVLSGGACVSIYSNNRYQSSDLDFVENVSSGRKKIRGVLDKAGFKETGRHFKHPDSSFFVEFPPGPLAVGEEKVKEIRTMDFPTGRLTLISPTDCIKDRLAAYYHWNDLQSLEQARLVARDNPVDLGEIKRWSKVEGKLDEYNRIKDSLKKDFHANRHYRPSPERQDHGL